MENDDSRPKPLPPWHSAVVPGEQWTMYYRSQRRTRPQAELEQIYPPAALVDPPTYPD